MSDTVLSLRKATKLYAGVPAIEGVDFDLRRGEIHALVGENGAGKSTLTKVMAGVVTLTSGSMTVDGSDVAPRTPLEARNLGIAMVFQSYALFPHMTVLDNVAYGRIVGGEPAAVARRKAAEFIGVVGLTGFESHLPSQLSGGHAAAGRAGPRAGHRCRDPADGRSVQRAGPADPHRDAGAVEGDPEPTGQDCGLHHP